MRRKSSGPIIDGEVLVTEICGWGIQPVGYWQIKKWQILLLIVDGRARVIHRQYGGGIAQIISASGHIRLATWTGLVEYFILRARQLAFGGE